LDVAQPYHRNPEKIANKVYADRMGNGDEASGDGFKYRGRGLIQLTGKDNYKACGDALNVDLVENPDLVSSPQYAALSAGWFWDKNKLNQFADANDMTTLTKRINGGTHGLDDRVARTQHAIDVLMA
jgi:putative chitinase